MVESPMSQHHQSHRLRRTRERSAAAVLVLAAMLFMLAAGGILAFYFIPNPSLLWRRSAEAPPPNRHVEMDLEGTRFFLPERLIARTERSFLGGLQHVDLWFPWPYEPGAMPEARADDVAPEDRVFVSIEPKSDDKLPEERFDEIYKVYLLQGSPAEAGLTRFPFDPKSPYADSELYVTGENPPSMIMRCDLRRSTLGPMLCERIINLTDTLRARIRFAKSRITEWQGIVSTARQLTAGYMRRAE